eukprot:scaffold82269_cov40-Attheya_sp.AAC.3
MQYDVVNKKHWDAQLTNSTQRNQIKAVIGGSVCCTGRKAETAAQAHIITSRKKLLRLRATHKRV